MFRGKTFLALMALVLVGCTPNTAEPTEPPIESSQTSSAPAGATSTGSYVPALSDSFDEPWSTDVSREEMIETALFKLFEDLDSIRNPDCEIKANLFTSKPLLEEHEPLLREIADGMVTSFCDYLTTDIPVIAGRYDFVKQVIAEQGLPSDPHGGICGFPVEQDYASACAMLGVAWTGISLGSVREGESYIEERRLTIAAHELFHVVHDQINPQGDPGLGTCKRFDCSGPVWFFEGAGEFFGRAMTQYLGLQNYATFVPTDRSGFFLDGEYLSDLQFLSDWGKRAGSTENYYSGQVAMEYIIANKGLIPLLGIWEGMSEGEYFPVAFENELGISLQDFYSKFKTLHLRLYEEEGHCDSKLGCSPWNRPTEMPTWFNEDGSSVPRPGEENAGQDGGSDSGYDECFDTSDAWWLDCMGMPFQLPRVAENGYHNFPTDPASIPSVKSCDEMELIGYNLNGLAATFDARSAAGATDAFVSTQIYAWLGELDENRDGVVCSTQAPEG